MTETAQPVSRASAPVRAMPVFSCTLQLNTDFAQRVYKRSFDRLKADLYVLTVRTRSSGMDEAAKAIEVIISEAFSSARKDLDAELERSDVLLDEVKLAEWPEYEGALITKAKYSTPRAKEYLDLLLKLDQLLMRYDALWLTGHVETQPRVARSQNWQRRLIKIANRLRELGNRTRASLSKGGDKRATGATDTAPAVTGAEPTSPIEETTELEEPSEHADEVPEEFRDPADLVPTDQEVEVGLEVSATVPEMTAGAAEPPADEASTARPRRRRLAAAAATT